MIYPKHNCYSIFTVVGYFFDCIFQLIIILGLPIVQFKSGDMVPIKSEKWIVKTPCGKFVSRQQVPLKLAWAFSIHKSQVIVKY